MEISWLQDFIALAQTGVFARAAEKRNVTQPAFTRRIKRLEYAIGADLIDRSVHPVVLTQAGQNSCRRPKAWCMIGKERAPNLAKMVQKLKK